ncbi:HAD family hydrolase [Intestinirhabdus alba]|jgi:HAD superfamily hydrolase (TIGR01490 family)|uniref:HAD-IB family hydrolase n=1 Tax=Intestinirhabdus alba TaxID=2899544 RepID=A0A6L6IJ64_9ENTR|nr:HAD-IB family hydrolase [Intestinirhabdus alba]MTH45748.1 HAD-IB family hydrolase [Intestinirhabdus alba]
MICAFFDVDGTILKINSMLSFFDYWTNNNKLNKLRDSFYKEFKRLTDCQCSREVMNKKYYSFFKGFSEKEIFSQGQLWFNDQILNKDVFIQEVVALISEHKIKGHKIVFVSGSMLPLLEPIGRLLNVDDILCVKPVKNREGILTGDIGGFQTIGIGKKEAILEYATNQNIDLVKSYSYGDDITDMSMMECVGNAVCVGGDSALALYTGDISNKNLKIINI